MLKNNFVGHRISSRNYTITTYKGSYATTENISYGKLLNSDLYEYIGKADLEREKSEPVNAEVIAEMYRSAQSGHWRKFRGIYFSEAR